MSAYPFSDVKSFKEWQEAATKLKPAHGVKPPPPPSDSEAPSAEEKAMTAEVIFLCSSPTLTFTFCTERLTDKAVLNPCHNMMIQLESLVRPELKDGLRDGMATRFVRGYALRSYVNAPDRLDRTAAMLNLTLEWRKEVDAANLAVKEVANRAEWDRLGPQCFPGADADGRVLYYMLFPEDLTKIPLEDAKLLHFQDMLRLEEVKANASKVRAAAGLPVRHHHVLILDLGNPQNAMSRSLLNWFKEVITHPFGPSITRT